MTANPPTQKDGEMELRKTLSLIAGGYGVNGDARGEIVDDLMHLIKSKTQKAELRLLEDLNDCGELHHSVFDYRIAALQSAPNSKKEETTWRDMFPDEGPLDTFTVEKE